MTKAIISMQNLITFGGRIYSISKKQFCGVHHGLSHIFRIICYFVFLFEVIDMLQDNHHTFSNPVSAQLPADVDLAILDIYLSNEFPNESEEIVISIVVQDLHDNGSGRLHVFATVCEDGINRSEEIHGVDISGLGHAYLIEINWIVLRNTTKITAFIDNQTLFDENLGNNIASIDVKVNNRPIAILNAEVNETLSLVPVIFDASSSYDEDGIFAYKFDFGDGSGTSWQSLPNASHIYTKSSSKPYMARVVVRDTKGLESLPASFEITVNNRLPIIKAYISNLEIKPYETYNVSSIEPVSFSSFSADLDGDIVNVSWDFGDGCVSYTANATHVFTYSEIPYIVQLHVTDNLNGINETSFKVRVQNIPPSANFSIEPIRGNSTTTFCFDASSSFDLDGNITTYIWNFGDGTTEYGKTVQHRFYTYGIFNISLIVIDDRDAQSVSCIKKLVVDNTPAKAWFFYTTYSQGSTFYTGDIVIFNATFSEDADGPEEYMIYLWKFGDGFVGTGVICEHVYSRPGRYEVELVVVDSAGEPATVLQTIEIKNRAPQIVSANSNSEVVRLRENVYFSIIAEDLDGRISKFVWDFDGDGKEERVTEIGNTTYLFEQCGNFLVKVDIFDELGVSNSTNFQIKVISPETGFEGLVRFTTAVCGYAITIFLVVFLCIIVWYVITKTNEHGSILKIKFKKDKKSRINVTNVLQNNKTAKKEGIQPDAPVPEYLLVKESKELTGSIRIDKTDMIDINKKENKNEEKVELMPAMEKVITYEIEKMDEEVDEMGTEEDGFASTTNEKINLDNNLENKQEIKKSKEPETKEIKNEIKVEFMEIESKPKEKTDIELKSIRSEELFCVVKSESKEKDDGKTILLSKDSERALAEKEEAKKTVKRLNLAEEKLKWCEERLKELTDAGVLSEAEKEDIAGPIRLGRTYLRSKNASKAEKFARRAEEEAKHYLTRLKKQTSKMQN